MLTHRLWLSSLRSGILVSFILLFAAGCSSKISEANRARIRAGMSLEDVEKILGRKGKISLGRPGFQTFEWSDGNPPKNQIIVEFRSGKVDGMILGNFGK